MTEQPFFTDSRNLEVFNALAHKIKSVIGEVPRDSDTFIMLNLIGVTANHMFQFSNLFEERCLLNRQDIGESLIQEMRGFSLSSPEDVEYLFVRCYRFLIEFQVCSPNEQNLDVRSAISSVVIGNMNLSPLAMSNAYYAEHQMLVEIVKQYLHHPEMVSLRQLPSTLEQARVDQGKFNSDLNERENKVKALKDALDEYKDAFNFVGLHKGFKELHRTKTWQKWRGQAMLTILASFMVFPFLAKFYVFIKSHEGISVGGDFYLTLLGLELLLMYFFRVVLQGYKAVQAQLLQIDLRMTLCTFIQSYADYAKGIRASDADLLVRFEQVVFSGIVNSDEKIPSSFDGLDQIGKIVSTFKKPT